ncbi:MAG: transporter substrate-binding domain-containing protein [Rhodocyclaceae bacterium]|nr:MAG: transporter substrate-binding domain-containing protein [Rhodocyclaceae bacterium]
MTPQRLSFKALPSRTDWIVRLAAVAFFLCFGGQTYAGGLEDIRAAGVIRVCADPDNLPFSSMALNPAGYDLEIAGEIARNLNVQLDYLWFHTSYSGRVLRQLYENNCDFFMGLPTTMAAHSPRMLMTAPYLRAGFVPVVRQDSEIRSLEEAKGEKIGVEMMTVADFHLFRNGYTRDLYRSQEEMFQALRDRRINVAVMWFPVAGWEIKSHADAGLKLLPVTDQRLEFALAIGVRKEDADLRSKINDILDKLRSDGTLGRMLAHYGLDRADDFVR